ncbi:FxsA family protein [Caenispirillum salinarum]|uniref:FxsA family protein n=1 Tax=Caenispirillum salinarum TaxID=859058 RepID=UPI00384EF1D9
MPLILLVLFIAVPVIEIGVFIQVGGLIGLWPTLGIVILTAVAGTALLKQQGLAVMRRAQDSLNRGEMPLREVFDGACLLFAGALLLTPGFVTDAFGLLLFLPPFRDALRRTIVPALVKRGKMHYSATYTDAAGHHHHRQSGGGAFGADGPGTPGSGAEIDGDYRDVTPDRPEGAVGHRDDGDDAPPEDMPPRPGPPRS